MRLKRFWPPPSNKSGLVQLFGEYEVKLAIKYTLVTTSDCSRGKQEHLGLPFSVSGLVRRKCICSHSRTLGKLRVS